MFADGAKSRPSRIYKSMLDNLSYGQGPKRDIDRAAMLPNRVQRAPPAVLLVVDDEPDIRESLSDLLTNNLPGVRVLSAENGAQAIEILRREPVGAILCDYRMAGMDGLAVLTEARRVAPDAARILITAYPELQVALRAINEARIQNFITKPVQPNHLIDIVKAALAKPSPEPTPPAPVQRPSSRPPPPWHRAA